MKRLLALLFLMPTAAFGQEPIVQNAVPVCTTTNVATCIGGPEPGRSAWILDAAGAGYLCVQDQNRNCVRVGADVPGLGGASGSIGNDLTLDYVTALLTFKALPDWPRFFFSAEAGSMAGVGDDANPCTPELPCRQLDLIDTLLDRKNVIIVMDGDVWDDSTNEWGGLTQFTLDNTGCGTGPTGTLTDEPCAFVIPWDPYDPPIIDGSLFDPLGANDTTNALFLFTGTGSGYWGFAGLRTTNLQRNPWGSGAGKNIFESTGTGANAVFVNVFVDHLKAGAHGHAYRPGISDWVFVNSGSRAVDLDTHDASCVGLNNPWGCCDAICAAGGSRAGLRCSSDDENANTGCPGAGGCTSAPFNCGGSAHLLEFGSNASQGTHLTVIGGSWINDNTDSGVENASGDATQVMEPNLGGVDVAWLGSLIRGPAANDYAPSAGLSLFMPQLTGVSSQRIARNTIVQNPIGLAGVGSLGRGIFIFNESSVGAGVVNLEMYQNTLSTAQAGLLTSTQFSGDTVNIVGRCNVFDGSTADGANRWAINVLGSPSGRTFMNFDGTNVYDEGDGGGTNVFSFAGVNFATAAAVTDSGAGCPGGEPCIDVNADWFGDGTLELGGGDVDAFAGLTVQRTCTNADCAVVCPEYTIMLPTSAFIPTSVVGAKITGFRLATHFKRMGAR